MLQAIGGRSTLSEWLSGPNEPFPTDDLYVADTPEAQSRHRRIAGLSLVAAFLFSMLALSALVYFREAVAALGDWNYLGIFIIQMINSSTLLIPTPGQAYAFAMGVTLNPLLLGVVGGTGAAIGELTGYVLGAKTGPSLQSARLYMRFQRVMRRWLGLALFSLALLPGPFEMASVCAGACKYPLWRFMVLVVTAKILKVTAFAVAGYYSITWLLGPLG